ncbi:MAG: tyrosine-protein phosphatase [Sporolactobacillus sp.]
MENELMERVLPVQGAYNFRDMGGLKTKDGRKVKKGLLYRSADLTDLTNEDINFLQNLDFHLIFDYRDKAEAVQRPDPQIAEERHERIAVNGEDKTTAQAEWDPGTFYHNFSMATFTQVYAQMPIQNASYHQLMMHLSHPEQNLPLLHHCAGGRDRTGVGAMLILMTLDVSFDTIMEDYLLSNRMLKKFHQATFQEAGQFLNGQALKKFEHDFLVQEPYLNAAALSIEEHYGSFDHYLEREFGINEAIREKIMDFCLE